MIIAYTPERLKIKNAHSSPVVRIYENGRFYIYKSLLKRLKIEPQDKILFSYDNTKNEWYVSKNNHSGIVLYTATNKAYRSFCSSVLRSTILQSISTLIGQFDTQEAFYLKASKEVYKLDDKGNIYLKVEIIK